MDILNDPRFTGIEKFDRKIWGQRYNRDNQERTLIFQGFPGFLSFPIFELFSREGEIPEAHEVKMASWVLLDCPTVRSRKGGKTKLISFRKEAMGYLSFIQRSACVHEYRITQIEEINKTVNGIFANYFFDRSVRLATIENMDYRLWKMQAGFKVASC